MNTTRSVLTLGKKVAESAAADAEVSVQVGLFDLQLPARQFLVHHKVAVLGDFSLTTEFLLRLLHSVDGMCQDDVATFFDFSAVEMAFVVDEAEARAFISRADGRLWLTDAGYALFKDGEKPQIYEVQKRVERTGFDLLSLAPCERESLSNFERALPELDIRDTTLAASASQRIPESFRRFYGEITSKRDKDPLEVLKRTLYSVDEVVAGDRFTSLVPVAAVASVRKPGEPEPSLDAWRRGHEVSDRGQVVHAVAAFLDNLKVVRRPEDNNAFDVLAEIAPEYLKDYVTKHGFSVFRFFRDTASRAGELRADRHTVGIVGPLYAPDNVKRIVTAIGYAQARQAGEDSAAVWVLPMQSFWGASRAFVNFLDKVKDEGVSQSSATVKVERLPIFVGCGKPSWHLVKAAPKLLVRPDNGSIPSSLEIFLIPQRVAALTVHSPITEAREFPVPLGILSFDPAVVRRVHEFLQKQLPPRMQVNERTEAFDIAHTLQWDEPVPSKLSGDSEGRSP